MDNFITTLFGFPAFVWEKMALALGSSFLPVLSGFFFALLALYVAGILRVRWYVPVAYTRKIVHILVFLAVGYLQYIGGIDLLAPYGFGAALALLIALAPDGNIFLYKGIARRSDEPHCRRYIILPFAMTILGGLVNSYAFGELVLLGYLVAGFGGAAGEPVGHRFGRYHWPSRRHGRSKKTYEGSAGVFLGTFIALLIGVSILDVDIPFGNTVAIAMYVTLIEVISPRGTNNFFMQVAPVLLVVYAM